MNYDFAMNVSSLDHFQLEITVLHYITNKSRPKNHGLKNNVYVRVNAVSFNSSSDIFFTSHHLTNEILAF